MMDYTKYYNTGGFGELEVKISKILVEKKQIVENNEWIESNDGSGTKVT